MQFESKVKRMSTTHVAINRRQRVAQTGQLYVREGVTVSDTDYYAGYIDVPDTLHKQYFEEALEAVNDEIAVGANRSRGMGALKAVRTNRSPGIDAPKAEETLLDRTDDETTLAQRVSTFNLILDQVLNFYAWQTGQTYQEIELARQNRYFTIALHSPLLVSIDASQDLYNRTLSRALNGINASIVGRWTKWETISGWQNAAALPRRTQLALSGVMLCRFNGIPDMIGLLNLEMHGLGLMREQGFGQFTVCPERHTHIRMFSATPGSKSDVG
jgi:hypothetical protein